MITSALTNGKVRILDANGDPFFTAANPGSVEVIGAKPDGTNTMPSLDSAARRGYFQHTDGANVTPAMDAVNRPGYVRRTDGINTAPTMDAVARAGYQIVTDGADIMLVNGDGSLNSVVSATDLDIRDLTSAQDDVSVTTVKPDGANTMPSLDTAARRGYVQLSDGTIVSGVVLNADDDTNLDGTNGVVTSSMLYGRIDADTVKPFRMDASTHSIQTIDYPHHEIHSGSSFAWMQSKQFANAEIDYFVITTPNTTKWAHFNVSISTEGEGHFEIWENPTISAAYTTIGSAVSNPAVINLNRNSATANTTLMQDATIGGSGVDGTRIAHIHITAGQKTGAERSTKIEIILKQNEDYLLVFENKESQTNYFQWITNWYEHTDKD